MYHFLKCKFYLHWQYFHIYAMIYVNSCICFPMIDYIAFIVTLIFCYIMLVYCVILNYCWIKIFLLLCKCSTFTALQMLVMFMSQFFLVSLLFYNVLLHTAYYMCLYILFCSFYPLIIFIYFLIHFFLISQDCYLISLCS